MRSSKALPSHGLVFDTVRSHRVGIAVWAAGGSLAMYAIAAGFASEVARFRGGARALAASMAAATEALRLLRWPAERLDTLGGYVTYHNVTLFVLFLSLYAGILGTRAVRGLENRRSLEVVLATGRSRAGVLGDRTAGSLLAVALISAGVGLGLAVSMAAGGAADTGGALITAAAAGLCALPAFALGLLLSQLMVSTRAAGGLTALVVTGLYVFTNVWEKTGPLRGARFLSPFFYFGRSRALVPGYGFDLPAAAALVVMTALLLGTAAWAFRRRDYAAPLWARRARRPRAAGQVQRPLLRAYWTAALVRERYGLLAWAAATAFAMGVMAWLEPGVVDLWDRLGLVRNWFGTQPGHAPAEQYLSFAAEIVAPVVAAFVITRAAAWVADLRQGRVELVLAAPVSWPRLVGERLAALLAGVLVITAGSVTGLVIGAAAVGAPLSGPGLLRLAIVTVLLGAALGGVAALVVAWLRSGLAVTLLAVLVAASYLLTYLAQLFGWPGWTGRLSVFGAFGRPYLELPAAGGLVFLGALAVLGAGLAATVASRSPKAA
ncbi:MAG: ABC transporter permease subunit [Gemmatimonadota bacterium]